MHKYNSRFLLLIGLLAMVFLPNKGMAFSTNIVADFKNGSPLNRQGGTDWQFQANGGTLTAQYQQQGLHLAYDVRASGGFAGYVAPFAQPLDVTSYNALILVLRGGSSNEHVKVGIGDSADHEQKVLASQFVAGGMGVEWQAVMVPLRAFTTINRQAVTRVVIAFENLVSPESGSLDVSEIKFINTGFSPPLPVENFDDGTTETAEGGRFWSVSGGGGSISGRPSNESASGIGRGYRVVANVQAGAWASLAFDLRGLDVHDANSLSLFMKGAAGGEKAHIYLVSGAAGQEVRKFVELESYASISTDWQRVSIPLNDFMRQGVDLSQLARCEVVWEWASLSETMWLDDISFRPARTGLPELRPSAPPWDFTSTGASIQLQSSGTLLQFAYDVTQPGSYGGHVMPFSQPVMASDYNALAFQVRGGRGGEHVKIGIGDSSNQEQKVLVSQFLPGGITTAWHTVMVPLNVFTTVNRSAVTRIVVAFENQLGAESGSLELDNIRIINSGSLLSLPAENFDDGTTETAEGGQFWTTSGGGGVITGSRPTDSANGEGSGYQVTTSVQPGAWAVLAFDLRGLDVHDMGLVTFFLKGGGKGAHIYLVSGPANNEVRKYVNLGEYAQVSADWREVAIPLQDFATQGVDLTTVTRLEMVWEWATLSETIWIDDISFRAASSSPDVVRPSGPAWDFTSGASVQLQVSGSTLNFTYNVTQAGSYGGHVIPFSTDTDVSDYNAIALRVRGASGGEHVKLGIGDSNNQEQKVLISQFLPGGITASWRNVVIPLGVFTTVNHKAVNRVVIAFENQLGAESGQVSIDDVRIINTGSLLPLPAANFDDGTVETAEGGHFWTTSGGGGAISGAPAAALDSRFGNSYRVAASVQAGSWAVLGLELRGLDAREQGFLTFLVKGDRGGEHPHLYLVSGAPGAEVRKFVDLANYGGITPSWERLSIPLHDFSEQGVDLSQVTRCEIVWEWSAYAEAISLDELAFVPAAQGRWTTLAATMPINPVHMALMNNGKVLVVAGSGNVLGNQDYQSAVFDLQSNIITKQPVLWDMFCNGMAVLPDGRPLVVGGTAHYDPFYGARKSSAFDPVTGVFANLPDMQHGRWYPTVTTLGNGDVMTFSGLSDTGGTNQSVEIYSPATGWSQEYVADWTPPLYPRLHLLPNGKVFYAGETPQSNIFDPLTYTWTMNVAQTNYQGTRRYGTSVLLPLTAENGYQPRVMIMGGGNPGPEIQVIPGVSSTEIIDLSQSTPQWLWGPPMSQPRIQMNATILPNGKILATGGSANDERAESSSFNSDLFDAAGGTFSGVAANVHPRLYHSNALLLPDATVLLAGGNPERGKFEEHIEVYSPSYLFERDGSPAARPVITAVTPAALSYASGFQIQTPDAANISSVVLVRPGAPTHSFDMDQRLVGLSFTAGNGVLNVTAPSSGNIAPPGYYMLFILNSNSVPSTAVFVKF